jgi:hypothetical protein
MQPSARLFAATRLAAVRIRSAEKIVGIIVPVGVGFVDEGTGRIHGRPVASTQLQLHPKQINATSVSPMACAGRDTAA